jgi:hypothetical protein
VSCTAATELEAVADRIELAVEFDTPESAASVSNPSFLAIGPCLAALYIDPTDNTETLALLAAQNESKSL